MAQRVKGAPSLQSIKSLPVGYAFDLNKSETVNHRMASNAAVSKNGELSSEANGNADGYIDESPYGRLNFSVEESPSSCDDDLRTNAFASSKWSDTTSYVTKKDSVPEVLNNTSWSEMPPSPASSYNSVPFSSEDFNEKLPDLPPLLQQTPLDLPSL